MLSPLLAFAIASSIQAVIPVPGARDNVALASSGAPDTKGLTAAQLDLMFDAAVGRSTPGKSKRAICVGMQGLTDQVLKDAPQRAIKRLSKTYRLPAVPASQCGFDRHPFVIATKAEAILYTVKVQSCDDDGTLTILAGASYGNLGGEATQFRLVRDAGRWILKPTGLSIVA